MTTEKRCLIVRAISAVVWASAITWVLTYIFASGMCASMCNLQKMLEVVVFGVCPAIFGFVFDCGIKDFYKNYYKQ